MKAVHASTRNKALHGGAWRAPALNTRQRIGMASQALDYNKATRWSKANLETCRAGRRTAETIAKHVRILEGVAKAHDGVLPNYKWLEKNGYWHSYNVMREHPAAFAHIKTTQDKKDEIYKAKGSTGSILPPSKVKTLAEYNVPGAEFNPTCLHIEPGTAEGDWMQIGRALADVCQSAYWWVGDWLQYGFRTYGKKNTFDLAMQATGYTRSKLYECAYIAKKFPPERRCGALTFFHHQSVAAYPPAVADKVLAEAVEYGLTGRQAAEAAAEETNEPRKFENKTQRVTVSLWPDTYEALKQRADGMSVQYYVVQVLQEHLTGRPIQRYANGRRTKEFKAALKGVASERPAAMAANAHQQN